MFEIDFFKLIIVAMIGLLVLGPEKLPGLAAKLGRWMGRARTMARQFRMQLEQEVLLEEARQQNKQTIRPPSATPASAQPVGPTDTQSAPSHSPQGHDRHDSAEPVSHAVSTAAVPTHAVKTEETAQPSQPVRTHD
jgi:sec-independent protein translocase protein TatB